MPEWLDSVVSDRFSRPQSTDQADPGHGDCDRCSARWRHRWAAGDDRGTGAAARRTGTRGDTGLSTVNVAQPATRHQHAACQRVLLPQRSGCAVPSRPHDRDTRGPPVRDRDAAANRRHLWRHHPVLPDHAARRPGARPRASGGVATARLRHQRVHAGRCRSIADRAATVTAAQRARGLDTQGSIRKRLRGVLPIVGPVVLGAIEEVEERTLALEARAFAGPGPRTLLWSPTDSTVQRLARWALVLTIPLIAAARITGIPAGPS